LLMKRTITLVDSRFLVRGSQRRKRVNSNWKNNLNWHIKARFNKRRIQTVRKKVQRKKTWNLEKMHSRIKQTRIHHQILQIRIDNCLKLLLIFIFRNNTHSYPKSDNFLKSFQISYYIFINFFIILLNYFLRHLT